MRRGVGKRGGNKRFRRVQNGMDERKINTLYGTSMGGNQWPERPSHPRGDQRACACRSFMPLRASKLSAPEAHEAHNLKLDQTGVMCCC